LTLKQLETFYWVSRLRSFVLAAERLHSTQSAVSMRIKDLEVSLGVSLFDRTQRSAQLTAKGQELLKYAEKMIATASQIRDRVAIRKFYPSHFGWGSPSSWPLLGFRNWSAQSMKRIPG